MTAMKPIETVYNGHRFRSRLEARWAVFFDAAGWEYEYEPDGFRLPDGKTYLPDFFLPRENLYVEIKPVGALYRDGNKLRNGFESCLKYAAAREAFEESGKNYAVFVGSPLDIAEHKNNAFALESIPYILDRYLYSLRDEAEFSSFLRFEHGENPDGYARKFMRGKITGAYTREKAYEKNILGILLTVPHIWSRSEHIRTIVKIMSEECDPVFWKIVHVFRAVSADIPQDDEKQFDEYVRKQTRERLGFLDRALFDVLTESRDGLRTNTVDILDAYLQEWEDLRKQREYESTHSLDEILKRWREEHA